MSITGNYNCSESQTVSKVRRGGIFKINALILKVVIGDFLTGKNRITNPGLKLMGIRRIETDFNLAFDQYELSFLGDDLPILEEGCYPKEIVLKPVEYTTDCFRFVEY